MFARKDYCVGCKAPLVDETVEGDLIDGLSDEIDFENARDNKTFANMVVGSENGCRNCILFLDASSFISTSKDQKRCRFAMRLRRRNRTLEIYFEVLGDGETGSLSMQVFRQSSQPQATESCDSVVWNLKEYRALSENTSSHETLDLIASWATQCVECHEHCPPRLTSRLPKRVLKITADHVYLREIPNVSAPYACLSHCWGPYGPAIKLTADTVELLHKGYATSELPKTFRDAVNVCRRLGIDYLWIDALCILQDSREDWKEAAATMANIYEHAYVTIAATSAQDSKGGLFSSARPLVARLDKHPHLYIREYPRTFPEYSHEFPNYSYTEDLKPWPLLTRAWVYQERRLSTRTVHFGEHQVYWECQTCFASEDASEDKVWKTDSNGRYGNTGWGDKIMDGTRQWQQIISEYTNLKLTYDSDRLPAIAALADRTWRLRRSDDVYIAGLWRNSILSDMLWTSKPFELGKWGQALEPRPTRLVPSWSWASVQNAKIFWSGYTFPDTTKIVSLNYAVIGAAHLGEVSNASIVLKTHVLDLTGTEISYPPWSLEIIDGIVRSSPPLGSFARKNSLDVHCSFHQDYDLTTAQPPYMLGHVLKLLASNQGYSALGGVVVRQIDEKPVQWERIGFLKIVFMKAKTYGESGYRYMAWYRDDKWERRIEELIQSLPVEEMRIV